jgi:predicted nuclease with TOPRIM domain
MVKVQEGFEGGIYTLDEAKKRIADQQVVIAKVEKENQRLNESMKALAGDSTDIEAMREKLKELRDRNLDKSTFEEKLEIISKLGIKVYPSEDLRSIRVFCQVDLG